MIDPFDTADYYKVSFQGRIAATTSLLSMFRNVRQYRPHHSIRVTACMKLPRTSPWTQPCGHTEVCSREYSAEQVEAVLNA